MTGRFVTGGCEKCGTLPRVPQAATLHIWLPIHHSFRKLADELESAGIETAACNADTSHLALALSRGGAASTVHLIRAILSGEELDGGRGLVLAAGEEPSVDHFAEVAPLRVALGRLASGWLLEILREDRLTTWFQPIVNCTGDGSLHGHECLMRAHEADGTLILPGPMMASAGDADLTYQLDLAARRQAVRSAARARLDTKVFINFSPAAIYDPEFCLRSTTSLVEQLGLRPEQVVFEIIEADRPQDINHLRGIVAFYQSRGFQVALDDMGAGYSSLNLIHVLRPDYIKLDRQLVHDVARHSIKREIAGALIDMAARLRIATIAEGIERPDDFAWVADRGADYVQGFLFARPGPEPVTAVEPRTGASSDRRA